MVKKMLAALLGFVFLFVTPLVSHAQVIHAVRPGDSLEKISKQYGMKQKEIAKLNGLAKNARLVLGQAVLLPGSTYIVQPGESVREIARRHAIKEESLMRYNGLKSRAIRAGQKLKIPRPPKTTIWVGSYFLPKNKYYNDWILGYYGKSMSGVFMFEYGVDPQGNLKMLETNQARIISWRKDLTPYATITNLSAKGFDPELARRLMGNRWIRQKFISNIHSLLHYAHYKGVVIDFEQLKPQDRTYLNTFMKELAAKLHPSGMQVLIAVPPLQGDKKPIYAAAYDYKTLGKYVDRIFLMTYDWHWPGGPSGPIAPINRVRETLDYAVSVVPRSKLLLGIPHYAYDWTISGKNRTGTAYSVQKAIDLYIGYESPIYYDEVAASPRFRYVDRKGALHEVWFEDPRSLLAKFRLIKEYRLAGAGAWHLGLTMPQTEEILVEEFNVR